jgi:hypothetical protein
MGKVLSFNRYHKINEEESTQIDKKSAATAEMIIRVFFQMWQTVVPKIKGDYKDSLNDLFTITKADPEKRGEAMYKVIEKVIGLADPKYSEQFERIKESAKRLSGVYALIKKGSNGDEVLKEINQKIYDDISKSQENLRKIASESPKIKEESIDESQLFEKNIFTHERQDLSRQIKTLLADLETQSEHSPSENLRAKIKPWIKNLKSRNSNLGKEVYWADLKRKKRIEELENISNEIAEIQKNYNDSIKSTLTEIGVDTKIKNELDSILDTVNKAAEEISSKSIENIGATGEEKKEEDKKEDEYSEIVFGGDNLKKVGKNRERIRDIQRKINSVLTKSDQIKDDGLYGENTKKSVQKIASLYKSLAPEMLKDIDGSKMTTSFQEFLDKLEKNKDKIKDIFK